MKAEGSSKFKVPEGSAMGRERWGGTYPLDRGHGDKSIKTGLFVCLDRGQAGDKWGQLLVES